MSTSWHFGERQYNCEICFRPATTIGTKYGDFCQQCTDHYEFGSADFFAALDYSDHVSVGYLF